MDSIERMRRINDLTRELKQRGFAESSFEAIKQANQIYGSDEVEDHVKNGMIQKSAHERIMKDETMGDDSVPSEERKMAKVAGDVNMLTDKMNEIVRAINDLDTRLTEVRIRLDKQEKLLASRPQIVEPKAEVRVEAKAVERQVPVEEPVHKEEHPAAHVRKDEYDLNQRTGNFQSQDVAIDKMFYFGNKK